MKDATKPTRFPLPSFGVQVLIGLVLGVVLGLVARSMGADGVDATTGEVDPNWLTETLSTIGGTFANVLGLEGSAGDDGSVFLSFNVLQILVVAIAVGIAGATVMLTLTLSTLGLPLEGVGLLLAIDPILDMALIPTMWPSARASSTSRRTTPRAGVGPGARSGCRPPPEARTTGDDPVVRTAGSSHVRARWDTGCRRPPWRNG